MICNRSYSYFLTLLEKQPSDDKILLKVFYAVSDIIFQYSFFHAVSEIIFNII